MSWSKGRTFPPDSSEITMTVDTSDGATEHFIDYEPIPNLEDILVIHTAVFHEVGKRRTAGMYTLLGAELEYFPVSSLTRLVRSTTWDSL